MHRQQIAGNTTWDVLGPAVLLARDLAVSDVAVQSSGLFVAALGAPVVGSGSRSAHPIYVPNSAVGTAQRTKRA